MFSEFIIATANYNFLRMHVEGKNGAIWRRVQCPRLLRVSYFRTPKFYKRTTLLHNETIK